MTLNGDRVTHKVRPNEVTRLPRRHITMCSTPTRRTVDGGQVHTWHRTVAGFRHGDKGRRVHELVSEFDSITALWDAVTAFTVEGARTVLWAHNLGNEVRLTRALYELPARGWQLLAHNLAPRGTWMIWGHGKRRLTMTDLASVFPRLLPELGKLFGTGVAQAPSAGESDRARVDRAVIGERTIRAAVTAYLGWIDREDLGNFQLTGAGQSWATFRHRHLTHTLLVHEDQGAIDMERRAMWTGRCEAYWHGQWKREVLHEWDYVSAYPAICRDTPLPTRLVGPMPPRYPWRRYLTDRKVAILAHVRILTPKPVVPTLHQGRIVWPVGEFETTLWGPEILAAIEAGATVEVISGYLYRTAPALAQWAAWILDRLAQPDSVTPAWMRVVLKHWSTALIGRFSMAYRQWEEHATAPRPGVDRRTCIDLDSGETYEIMQVGTRLYRQTGVVEWQHSQPAITGYVMAVMRAKLWRTLDALPPRTALYADTDSILVPDTYRAAMEAVASTEAGWGLRLKRSWDGYAIFGPRQLVTGERVRVSGVPVTAERTGADTFSGRVWQSLTEAISTRNAGQVVVRDRAWKARHVDNRRLGPALGWTRPITIGA